MTLRNDFWRGMSGRTRMSVSLNSAHVLRGLMVILIRRAALYFVVSLLLVTIYSNARLRTYSNEAIAAIVVVICTSMVLTSMFFEKESRYRKSKEK